LNRKISRQKRLQLGRPSARPAKKRRKTTTTYTETTTQNEIRTIFPPVLAKLARPKQGSNNFRVTN
jgi:hypothetical protein